MHLFRHRISLENIVQVEEVMNKKHLLIWLILPRILDIPYTQMLVIAYIGIAFLANCRKGACGYVQCRWSKKSSVVRSFLNAEKAIMGSIIYGGWRKTVPGCWTSVEESTRADRLGGSDWYKPIYRCHRSQVGTTGERGNRYYYYYYYY